MELKRLTLMTFCLLLVFLAYPVLAVKVDLKEKLIFFPQTEKPIEARDFCVTDDGFIIIPDYGAGNIKIYEKNGKYLLLSQTVGQKGYGPDGLTKPYVCSYSNEMNQLVVMDIGLRKIFIYNRLGRLDFERDKLEIPCKRGAYDLQLKNDRLFISGYADDPNNADNGYEFYYVDLNDGLKAKYLLSAPSKYDVTQAEYDQNFGTEIVPYGIQGWFDLKDDFAYFVWEGNPQRILKIDTMASMIYPLTSKTSSKGKSAPRSFSSANKQQMADLKKNRDFLQVERLKTQVTPLVRRLFITKQNNILTILEGPFVAAGQTSIMAQLSTGIVQNGTETAFISGIQPLSKVYYDKNEGCLWALSGDNMLKYRIIE